MTDKEQMGREAMRILTAALERSPDERTAFLQQQCAGSESLLTEVRSLLDHNGLAESEAFLEGNLFTPCGASDLEIGSSSTSTSTASQNRTKDNGWNGRSETIGPTGGLDEPPIDPMIGKQLGAYQLVARLATGGVGAVYRAQRRDDYRQEIAVKILRTAMLDPSNVARFRAEQQAMADLTHPNICRLLDAGTMTDGSPYLVMELVDGGPIDEFCEIHRVETRQRVEWFLEICRAVSFAHGKGILHRDLKPSNVLISAERRPVITDFGLAKFLRSDAPTVASRTVTGQILGTPGYMAPEQAAGDTHLTGFVTDVYGLGAILYALLTGQPPFRSDSVADTLVQVRSEQPTPPHQLSPRTHRDLETICLRCLEKSPHQRYPSAAHVGEDVQRFLSGIPITARPIGAWERLSRWAVRNPVISAMTATLALVLLVSLITVTTLLVVAESRRKLAEDHARVAEEKQRQARETVDGMYTEVSRWLSDHPHTGELRHKLLQAARDAYQQFAIENSDDPDIMAEAATAHYRLAQIEAQLGNENEMVAAAHQSLERFTELARLYPERHQYQFDVFHCQLLLGNLRKAYEIIAKLIDQFPLPDYRDAFAGSSAGMGCLFRDTNPARARTHFESGLATAEQLAEEFPNKTLYRRHIVSNLNGLAWISALHGDLDDAAERAERSITVAQELVTTSPTTIGYHSDLCVSLDYAAGFAFAGGELEKSQSYFTSAWNKTLDWLSVYPESDSAREFLYRAQLETIAVALLRDDHDRARQLTITHLRKLEEIHRLFPRDDRTRLALARLLANSEFADLRDVTRAEKLCENLDIDQLQPEELFDLGIVQLRTGAVEQAVSTFSTVLDLDAHIANAALYRDLAELQLGKTLSSSVVAKEQVFSSRLARSARRLAKEIRDWQENR